MDKAKNRLSQYQEQGRYLLFCLGGGILGWLLQLIVNIQPTTVMGWMGYASLNEVALLPEAQVLSVIYPAARISVMFFSGLLSGGIAYVMSVAEMRQSHAWKDSLIKSLVFLIPALVIGAVTGFLAELIYETANTTSAVSLVFMNGLGWGIIGMGIAFTVSLVKICWKKMLGYAAGGVCGGMIAGVCFGLMSLPAIETDAWIKLAGALILGVLVGVGILVYHKVAGRKHLPKKEAI